MAPSKGLSQLKETELPLSTALSPDGAARAGQDGLTLTVIPVAEPALFTARNLMRYSSGAGKTNSWLVVEAPLPGMSIHWL